jgi:acetyltransferase-like isoleucine patch superfamily enzyme
MCWAAIRKLGIKRHAFEEYEKMNNFLKPNEVLKQKLFYTRDHLAKEIEQFGWTIGEFTYGCPAVYGKNQAKLHIGKFCSIAGGVRIFVGHEHRTDWITTYPFSVLVNRGWKNAKGIKGHPHTKGDVVIGHDVWLASNITILSGINIGTGAVISTGAVVTRDIPPYAIAAGVPAQVKCYRFQPDVIEKLLATQWWELNIEQINELIPLLLSNDPSLAINWLENNS